MKALTIITVISLAIFAAFPELDINFSRLFYLEGQGFPLRDNLASVIIYKSVRIFCWIIAIMCLFVALYDLVRASAPSFIQKLLDHPRSLIKFSRRQLMFLFLVIVITPGILVHWVMKPVWERARPVNVTEFGGTYEFTDFYHAGAGQDGKSFPSGHASMAFSIVALAYMVRESRRKKVLVVTIIYGVIASLCRVWQGGHYLSDVTFSAILTLWTILLLKQFYLGRPSKN
jgi:lipid A 4'-phosphatase